MRKISIIPYFCTIKAWWIAIHYVLTIGKFFFLIITIIIIAMRKFTQAMLVLLAFLGSTIGAVAQNYPVNVSETATITNANRVITGATLQPERGLLQSTGVKEGRLAYNDMTATETGTFKIKVGQTVYPRFIIGQWDVKHTLGDWMHSYFFVDTNQNGVFEVTGKDVENDELLTYYGKNGSQPLINGSKGFSISTAGTYRMRYLVDWNETVNSETSKGVAEQVTGAGGIIIDVNLQVEAITVNSIGAAVTYESAPAYGSAFTFTVPAKTGHTPNVSVKCGAGFDTEQASTTITYYNSSNSAVQETCYNWEQFTPTNNGDGTYTVPADKMKGDLQITVTYTKDVMALIKAGKQVFRIKNVATTDYPYLKVATADASSGSRFSQGDKILYHVNAETATADGASCLWRLMPAGTNQYYLRSQCLTLSDMKTVTTGSNPKNNDYPVKMDAAYDSEGNARGQIIYLHPTGSNYGFSTSNSTSGYNFMHAVVHGGPSSDDTKYPATQNGYYVTTWNQSGNASKWTFEAVDEIDITIGASGYASVNYDFPVKFPAGVKVYKKAEEAATYIRLAEITPGADGCVSLPTGNAAFVAGTPGASIRLEILLDEPEAIEGGTGVSGTYLATTFNETSAANIYGIAKVDGVVAFYKMRANTTIKQNKGYIESTTSNAPRMELTFGEGPTTGIESVLEDNSRRESIDTSVLYDLNGRRVLYPSRGIYVTASGQRIFLK